MLKVIPITIKAGMTGFASPATDYIADALSLDDLLITQPSSTYLGIADGLSMVDVGIYNGDLLIINRALEPVDGDVIVATVDGEFCCKLIDMDGRQLLSAAPDMKPFIISEIEGLVFEGVVAQSIRLHRNVKRLPNVRAD